MLLKKILSIFTDAFHSLVSNKKLDKLVLYEKLNLKIILLTLLAFGFIRVALESFWENIIGGIDFVYYPIQTSIGIIWYASALFVTTPLFSELILKAFYKTSFSKKKLKKVYIASTYIWILYPLVGLLNIIFKSPFYVIDAKYFSFIPFHVHSSYYLPYGMIIVIPILFYKFTHVIKTTYKSSNLQSFLAVFFSFVLIYLLAYHWLGHIYLWLKDKSYGLILLLVIAVSFFIHSFSLFLPKIFRE